MTTVYYVGEPFHPWWDPSIVGPEPSCGICGAVMVRCPRPQKIIDINDRIRGGRTLKDYDNGWVCLSCGSYKPDPPVELIPPGK